MQKAKLQIPQRCISRHVFSLTQDGHQVKYLLSFANAVYTIQKMPQAARKKHTYVARERMCYMESAVERVVTVSHDEGGIRTPFSRLFYVSELYNQREWLAYGMGQKL